MSNPCRFCGATNRQITKEHVWPDWLRDYLPTFDEDADVERRSPGPAAKAGANLLTTTARAFCDGCNSGWMADIEAAAKPIVGPMVIGQPMDLAAHAQQIVANWVALKGLVAAQATSSAGADAEDDRLLEVLHYTLQLPSRTTRVWQSLEDNLALGNSAWEATENGLQRRADRTAKEAFDATTAVSGSASDYLAEAWAKAYDRKADPVGAWQYGVRAVEAALRPIVCPNNKAATLSHVIGELRKPSNPQQPWKLNVPGRARNKSVVPLINMLELMWPEPNRHGSPTPEPKRLCNLQ